MERELDVSNKIYEKYDDVPIVQCVFKQINRRKSTIDGRGEIRVYLSDPNSKSNVEFVSVLQKSTDSRFSAPLVRI